MIITKAIRPKSLLFTNAIFDALADEAEAVANDILLDFELTCATWKHEVKFEKEVDLSGVDAGIASFEILVATDDEIYTYVNNGTKPHEIRPKNANALAFPSMFVAKSSPGTLVSGAGGSGGDTVFAKVVHHPGTEARKFDERLQKEWKPKFDKRMREALKRGSEKAMREGAAVSGTV